MKHKAPGIHELYEKYIEMYTTYTTLCHELAVSDTAGFSSEISDGFRAETLTTVHCDANGGVRYLSGFLVIPFDMKERHSEVEDLILEIERAMNQATTSITSSSFGTIRKVVSLRVAECSPHLVSGPVGDLTAVKKAVVKAKENLHQYTKSVEGFSNPELDSFDFVVGVISFGVL